MKNTARVRPEDLRGLKALAADYPPCEQVLLYRGTHRLKIDGIQCVPADEYLLLLGATLS